MILNIYDKLTGKIIYRKNGENKNKYYYAYEDGKTILSNTYKFGYIDGRKEFYKNFDDTTMVISEIYIEDAKIVNNIPAIKTIEDLKIEGKYKLIEGEYVENGKLYYIPYDATLNYLKPKFDINLKLWVESATVEELFSNNTKNIINYMSEIKEAGFVWKEHRQEVLPSPNDTMSLLANRILVLNNEKEGVAKKWTFDTMGYDEVHLNLEEYKELQKEGESFLQALYDVKDILFQNYDYYVSKDEYLNELQQIYEYSVSVIANQNKLGGQND